MFSEALLDRFFAPERVGDLAAPSAVALEGNPTCGDVVQVSIEVAGGTIVHARFRTLGCVVAIAASDAVCELAGGRSLAGAEILDPAEVASVLGGVPDERYACLAAPVSALRSAVRQVRLAGTAPGLT